MANPNDGEYGARQKQEVRQNVHRRNPEIGNSNEGKVSGSGGIRHTGQQPTEGSGEAGRRGRSRDSDRGREHRADQDLHSGMERAMHKHADKLHPVKK